MPRPTRTDPRVDLALAAGCLVLSVVALVLPQASRERVSSALRSTVVAPAAALQRRAEVARRAFLAHDADLRVLDSVSLRSQRLTGVEQENAQLRRLLGLASSVRWGFVPAELLEGRGLGDEFTVTLSAGRNAGIETLSPVLTPQGLVGVVQRADPSLSVAILWPHPDFRVSGMSADGATYGIATAHRGVAAERYLIELRSVPLRSQLRPGTLVVSSGMGGVFPRGIPIGTVLSEIRTSEAWARTYLLRPAVKFADLGAVMVLTRERAKSGLDGVWDLPALADSARRSVIAAGDSITVQARDSLNALERKRVADSLAALGIVAPGVPSAAASTMPARPVTAGATTGRAGATPPAGAVPPAKRRR